MRRNSTPNRAAQADQIVVSQMPNVYFINRSYITLFHQLAHPFMNRLNYLLSISCQGKVDYYAFHNEILKGAEIQFEVILGELIGQLS